MADMSACIAPSKKTFGLSKNLPAQQEQLDRFREDFNERRPHEALKMKCPADLYKPSLKESSDFRQRRLTFSKVAQLC